jgi:hypothetical protein
METYSTLLYDCKGGMGLGGGGGGHADMLKLDLARRVYIPFWLSFSQRVLNDL